MVVHFVALIRLCYLVLLWMMLCSIMTRRQWQWPPTASFAEASDISPSDSDASSSVQRQILTAFKQGIVEDGGGALASWNASQPVCSWKGVGCATGTHQVDSLNLPYSGLNGTVTPLLFTMPFLTYLNLSGNSLFGRFPDNISTSFEVLELRSNFFSGSIPASIGNLASLQWLDLSSNDFTGRIPPHLGNATNLIFLDLEDNVGLGGELPAELGACTKLLGFSVGVSNARQLNQKSLISGPSKAAFAIFSNMSSLQILAIQGTQVKGSIPAEISSLKTLTLLALSQNLLHGEIPRTLGNLSNLQQLFIQFGDFTGPIPEELGSCTQLQKAYVGLSSNLGVTDPIDDKLASYFPNNLNGSIPESFGQLQNLQELVIDGTQMGGNIPTFSNATALLILDLGLNHLTGIIPSDFASSIPQLVLIGNRLSGPIPPAMGNFSNLEVLEISEDDIEGNIPPELAFCQNLQAIEIGPGISKIWTANVTGSIPQEFGRLKRLQKLDLSATQLSGTIPSSLGNCSSLMDLTLSNNQLVGSLSAEIANLTALQVFYVPGYRLEGSLSAVPWNELKYLTEFQVSQNMFSGTIPQSLGTSVGLWNFGASSNQLVGTLPLSFMNFSSLQILDIQNNQMEGNISQVFGVLPGNHVTVILLASNRLYGTIPSWIATKFIKLFILILAENLLEGTVPASIWKCNSGSNPTILQMPLLLLLEVLILILLFLPSYPRVSRHPFKLFYFLSQY